MKEWEKVMDWNGGSESFSHNLNYVPSPKPVVPFSYIWMRLISFMLVVLCTGDLLVWGHCISFEGWSCFYMGSSFSNFRSWIRHFSGSLGFYIPWRYPKHHCAEWLVSGKTQTYSILHISMEGGPNLVPIISFQSTFGFILCFGDRCHSVSVRSSLYSLKN